MADSLCSRLVVLPETLESLPWTAAALKHGALAAKMRAGDFEIRYTPALQPATRSRLDRAARVVGISDPSDDLLLPTSEGPVFADLAGTASFTAVSAGPNSDIADLLAGADALIVSTHSRSITDFADPYFAGLGSLGGRSLVGVERLQQVAPRLRLSLVLLNACYSAVGSGRNYQKRFRSADRVSFPGLFVLNGRAVASGSAWRTSDTAGYLHSALVGRALGGGLSASRAVSRAIAELPALNKAESIALLERIPDDKTRRAAIARLDRAPAEGLFSAVYAGGGYSLYGLM